ncbi:hypothetical protein [Candidatus Poriferisodalis sp.]|uniref:hypothetical protein n=1 Tax=Candidatus Poriferisodalis sp. TaxID=3101277 RepID=UPI003B5172E8
MSQDPGLALPCVCAENAPREVRCHEAGVEISNALPSTSKRIVKRLFAFNARPTAANALRAREAYVAGLRANEIFLSRCRTCIEFFDGLDEIEGAIADYSAKIKEIDQMLADYESERASEQHPRNQRQQQQQSSIAKAQSAYWTTRRVMRWFNLR